MYDARFASSCTSCALCVLCAALAWTHPKHEDLKGISATSCARISDLDGPSGGFSQKYFKIHISHLFLALLEINISGALDRLGFQTQRSCAERVAHPCHWKPPLGLGCNVRLITRLQVLDRPTIPKIYLLSLFVLTCRKFHVRGTGPCRRVGPRLVGGRHRLARCMRDTRSLGIQSQAGVRCDQHGEFTP